MLWSRRSSLRAMGAFLWASPMVAFGFDRVSAKVRYRRWLKQLDQDLERTADNVPASQAVTLEHIGRWCERSVVPGSRGAQNFAEFLNLIRRSGRSYAQRQGSFLALARTALENSQPAGQG